MPDFNAYFQWCVDICEDPNVRYNQSYRNAGKDPDGYTCYDCSSFVYYGLIAGGWSLPVSYGESNRAFTTHNMIGVILSLDGWVEVSASGNIEPGDIGWNNSHTEVAYSAGTNGVAVWMGAHGRNGVAGANQVSIGSKNGNRNGTRSFDRVFRYEGNVIENGRSQYVIAAIAGNMDAESTLSPGTWESLIVRGWDSAYSNNSGGYGLAQWTNVRTNRGRLWRLYQWMTSSGYSMDSGEGQVAYIPEENYWTPRAGYPFQTLTEFLESDSTDIDMLTGAWNVCWEGIPLNTDRYALSRYYFNVITNRMDDATITSWVARNAFLSQAERDNNAVMLYRAMRGRLSSGGNIDYDPGYNAGDEANDPDTPNWFDLFTMALGAGGTNSQRKLRIKKGRW